MKFYYNNHYIKLHLINILYDCIPCAIFLNNIKNFNTKTTDFNSLIEGKIIHITPQYVFIKSKKILWSLSYR